MAIIKELRDIFELVGSGLLVKFSLAGGAGSLPAERRGRADIYMYAGEAEPLDELQVV